MPSLDRNILLYNGFPAVALPFRVHSVLPILCQFKSLEGLVCHIAWSFQVGIC